MAHDEQSPFSRLGRKVADAMGDGPSAERQLEQRARLVELASGEARRAGWTQRPAGGRYAWYGALAVLTCSVALVLLWTRPEATEQAAPIALQEQSTGAELSGRLRGQPLSSESWVTASGAPAELVFSDDSRLRLSEGARARVAELGREGLRLSLESGHLDADITPHQGYRWVIAAGPHRVTVLGTAFSVDWSPEAHRLEVRVSRGKVQVTDADHPEGDGATRVLVAGDQLIIEPPAGATAGSAASSDAPSPVVSVDDDLAREEPRRATQAERAPVRAGEPALRGRTEAAPVPGPVATQPPASADTRAPADSRWRDLAKAGRYREALTAARDVGIDGLVRGAAVSDLLLLADSARLGGDPGIAERALLSIRQRFPEHPNANVAAFSLGRLASEARGDQRAAIKWFQTYLRANPSGGLAEGARGRLLTAHLQAGDRVAARAAAKDYLKHHPSGRHASVARSLLDD